MYMFIEQIQNVIKLGDKIDVYNDLKNIIEDHQNVIKYVNNFFK